VLHASSVLTWQLVFERNEERVTIDVKAVRASPPLWALVVTPACLCAPALLTLLPWRTTVYRRFPSTFAMHATYAFEVSLSACERVTRCSSPLVTIPGP
jgi:hypothetical protein